MAVNKVVFGAVTIIDISDGTVTPSAMREGITAYGSNGEKLVGTIENYDGSHECSGVGSAGGGIDTSDATATASQMLSGATAYVNGVKITGTIETYSGEYLIS